MSQELPRFSAVRQDQRRLKRIPDYIWNNRLSDDRMERFIIKLWVTEVIYFILNTKVLRHRNGSYSVEFSQFLIKRKISGFAVFGSVICFALLESSVSKLR
jgi:hypothetical protein